MKKVFKNIKFVIGRYATLVMVLALTFGLCPSIRAGVMAPGYTSDVYTTSTDIWMRSSKNGVPEFEFRIGSGGVIAEMNDSKNSNKLIAPPYDQELTDRVIQWTFWNDNYTTSSPQDPRFNMTQGGSGNGPICTGGKVCGVGPIGSGNCSQLTPFICASVDTVNATIEVISLPKDQFLCALNVAFDQTMGSLTQYEMQGRGVMKVTRWVMLNQLKVNGVARTHTYAYFEGWSPFRKMGVFNAMAYTLNVNGSPNSWVPDTSVPYYPNTLASNTPGYAIVFNSGNWSTGGAVAAVVFGKVKPQWNSPAPITSQLYFQTQPFDTGMCINPAMQIGLQYNDLAPMPTGTMIKQVIYVHPLHGMDAQYKTDLDTLAATIEPGKVYLPGYPMPAEAQQVAARLNAIVGATGTRTDNLAPFVGLCPAGSPTPSPTQGVIGSSTPTSTATPTATRTATLSVTYTRTATRTPSSTGTFTPSLSPSGTPTITLTRTPSVTYTLTSTRSSTATATQIVTPNVTFTHSPTLTTSVTRSSTPSLTYTPTSSSFTGSLTASLTATLSQTQSVTASNTPTATPSSTLSLTDTGTRTPSQSPTVISSPTLSVTSTPSGTETVSMTQTLLPTQIQTLTATPSPVSSPTPSPTGAIPVAAEGVQPEIINSLAQPNPNPQSVAILLKGTAKKVTLRIYSKAMVLVGSNSDGPAGPGWFTLALPSGFLTNASSGLYYYILTLDDENTASGKIGKFMILK